MTGKLESVLVCGPRAAGWSGGRSWRELGYRHPPRGDVAEEQHRELVTALERSGVEVLELTGDDGLSLDAVYVHDASFPTNQGMILMHMGKATRRAESDAHASFFQTRGIPVLGRIEPPGVSEAGDMVWLDSETLLIGEGYRTNADGIEQMGRLLSPHGVDVVVAPLPHGSGPDTCLHLMSLISLLDERAAIVDLPWLSVSTVRELERRRFELIPIEPSERDTFACNVLSLGGGRLLAIAENEATNARLEKSGFDVATFPGAEISLNGSGGPTCLTRPLLRS